MITEEILELTTEELEAATDEKLLELLGPAIANCQPLPGGDAEDKLLKEEEKKRREEEKLLESANNTATTTTNIDGTTTVNGVVIQKARTPRKSKEAKAAEKMKELFEMLRSSGISQQSLPKELEFKITKPPKDGV